MWRAAHLLCGVIWQLLSAGCSCLDIPSPTTTLITASVLPKVTFTAHATASVQATITITLLLKTTNINDVTISSTADVTNTYTETFTVDVTATISASVTSTATISTPFPCGTNSPKLVCNSNFNYGSYNSCNIEEMGSGTYYSKAKCTPDYYCPLLYTSGPGSTIFQQNIATVPGQTHELSYYYIPGGSDYTAACAASSLVLPVDQGAAPYAFTYISGTFTATSSVTSFSYYISCSDPGYSANVNVDAPSVAVVC